MNTESSPLVTPIDTLNADRPLTHTQRRFYTSGLYMEARDLLQVLVDSPEYDTSPSRFTNNSVTFVERHLHYLSANPQVKLSGYISNLKLMTRAKHS